METIMLGVAVVGIVTPVFIASSLMLWVIAIDLITDIFE